MDSRRRVVLFALVLGIVAFVLLGHLYATNPSESGSGQKYWTTRGVVLGEITKVIRHDDGGDFMITIRPHSSLSGSIDPGLLPQITARLSSNRLVSASTHVPEIGEKVLTVILFHAGEYWVTSNRVGYMPEGSGLIGLESFDDPVVREVLSKIQAIRKDTEAKAGGGDRP